MTDLDLVRRITSNLFFWEGLRWIPFGVLLIFAGFLTLSPDSPAVTAGLWLLVALGAAAFWIEGRIGEFYRSRVGVAREMPGSHRRRTASKWMLVYPALLASLLVDLTLDPPILSSGVVWAGAIILYRNSTGRGRRHYLFGATGVAALTALPLLGVDPSDAVSLLIIVIGVIYVGGGVLDHLKLTQALHPVSGEESHDDTVH